MWYWIAAVLWLASLIVGVGFGFWVRPSVISRVEKFKLLPKEVRDFVSKLRDALRPDATGKVTITEKEAKDLAKEFEDILIIFR